MDGKNLVTINELVKLLQENQPDHPLFAEVKKVFESANAEELYNAATRENATPEDISKWGAYSLDLHQKMNAYLREINKTPERLNEYTIFNVNNAYAINTHLCVDALSKDPEGVVQGLVNRSYDSLNAMGKYQPDAANAKAYENELARLLYLGKLKFEMDNLHGTEQEMKAWKTEILTELMSDGFDEKVEAYKNSEIYKESLKLLNNSEMEPEEAVQRAILGIAEEKYHDVYHTFSKEGNSLADDANDKKEVETVTAELDEMRALADTVGTLRSGEPNKMGTEYSVYLDTITIRRRSELHGKIENVIGTIQDIEKTSERARVRAKEAEEDYKKKYREDHPEMMDSEKVLQYSKELKPLFEIDEMIDKEIKTFQQYSLKGDMNKANDSMIVLEGFKLKKTAILHNLEDKHPETSFQELTKHFESYLLKAEGIDRKYEEYIKKTKDFDKNVAEVGKNAAKRTIELYDDMMITGPILEKRRIKEEADQYKIAKEHKDFDKIKQIKESRESNDIVYRFKNKQFFEAKDIQGEKGLKTVYKPRSTKSALNAMEKDFEAYKEKLRKNKHEISSHTVFMFEANKSDFAKYDKGNDVSPKPVRPDRKGLTINAYKAPVVAELKIDQIDVQENVEKRAAEIQFVEVPRADYGTPSANLTGAIEEVEKKEKIIFGTQEYQDIADGLRELKSRLDNADPEQRKTELLPLARKLNIMMNHYLDRKADESDKKNGNVSTRAKERRQNMQAAQVYLEKTVKGLMQEARVTEEDCALGDLKADIENVVKLTGGTNTEVKGILSEIDKKDSGKALDLVKDYLENRVNDYYKSGKYNFCRDIEGQEWKYRIPSKKDERMYKAMLNGYDKLLKARLTHMQKTDSRKLENLKFHALHVNGNISLALSVNQRYGITTDPKLYAMDLGIKKYNDFEKYMNQFEDHYDGLATKMRNDSLSSRMYDPVDYNIANILTHSERTYMTEAALSKLFLEKNFTKENFNLEEAEQKRVSFISLMKHTDLFYRIDALNVKKHDLKEVEGDEAHIREESKNRLKSVYTVKDYGTAVVAEALKDELLERYKSVAENLGKTKDYNPEQVKADMDMLEKTIAIGKGLGLGETMEKVNEKIMDPKHKGANLEASVKMIKDAVAEKNMRKQIEPAKGFAK